MRKERLYNFLENCHVYDKEQRSKLAFACLLTSVGIPMIFAGDEFCDQQDLPAVYPSKEVDPVDYSRVREPWRAELFKYVANLIKFRKESVALSVNDTEFIHLDFEQGRRILAWVRGKSGSSDCVVVVANFSDCYTPGPEYVVHNWPVTPAGMRWREVTQQRNVPAEWVGREPIFPWEAKVYTLAPGP
jgi:1,4-alpha-glucan branching enzyme